MKWLSGHFSTTGMLFQGCLLSIPFPPPAFLLLFFEKVFIEGRPILSINVLLTFIVIF
jgi:hypothetical protein